MIIQTRILWAAIWLSMAAQGAETAAKADDQARLLPGKAQPCDATAKNANAVFKSPAALSSEGSAPAAKEAKGQGETAIFAKAGEASPKKPDPLTPPAMGLCK